MRWVKGKTKCLLIPSVASVAFVGGNDGSMVAWTASQDGSVIPATSTTDKQVGICLQTKASTDATTTPLLIEIPLSPACEFESATASLATTDVGGYFDLTDDVTVNRGATSNDAVICTGYISATRGRFMLNSAANSHSETWP